MQWGDDEEKFGVVMKKEQVKRGIDQLMDEGEEGVPKEAIYYPKIIN